mmetsp:Transcript_52960/g.63764  ORF Transcript_52960/g.63764 Transcript_52960/m.63764 type:complete len:538 (-) Transcript_52960:159-1772(-)|eukprot:CAMPEP_0172486360 /NCGR_PEP_ID=MMETSP1066-20121228/14907_1 /TAXON_ID=671091 /ORGANISM="Coscinodiscus wailesii, Strain CCMP2513" /LENGTH=537 /DNA_ID=CAMNT_0013252263 /DNA_START=123 /DNA_END=1736 /DNA_ORIENTATION=-
MTDTSAALESAVQAMTCTESKSMYDVTIVCTTDDFQAEYWMNRLSAGVCSSSSSANPPYPIVLAVSEDWAAGGAGNGLGTLYAYEKACGLAQSKFGIDLAAALKAGDISAALFHTAGKGTRMAPMPASENNNKPGVKLPFCHTLSDGSIAPITVLEAVVKQTGVYATCRKGRLSVYWGDQVFIPSAPFSYTPTHHVDIMCTLLGETAPTAEEWEKEGLEKYGVIAVSKGEGKNAAQVEKVDHATATKMLKSLGDIGQVGPSLGSFSVSAGILAALCEEYKEELTKKEGKFDTDPHFWMPFTLPVDDYVSLMSQKGQEETVSQEHHARMSKMKDSFDLGGMGLFGAVDVGSQAAWWDYGQLKKYAEYNMKMLESDENATLLRKFHGVTSNIMNSSIEGVTVDDTSCVFASSIKSGTITKAVVAAVDAISVEAEGAIVLNCTAKKIVAAKGAVLYNLIDDSDEGIIAKEGDVMVGVLHEDGETTLLKSHVTIDGGKAWKKKLDINDISFEDMNKKLRDSNVVKIEEMRSANQKKCKESF